MTASELFQAGQLQAAIDAQIQKVKAKPADQAARLFLFELLLFSGDLDRARKQLDVLNYDKPEATAAVESYRNALASEQTRRDLSVATVKRYPSDESDDAETAWSVRG